MDVDTTREAIAEATRSAGLAVANLMHEHGAALRQLPSAVRDGLVLRAAVAFLFSTEMVAPGPALLADEQWFALDLEEPYRTDLRAAISDAVASQARINAAADAASQARINAEFG